MLAESLHVWLPVCLYDCLSVCVYPSFPPAPTGVLDATTSPTFSFLSSVLRRFPCHPCLSSVLTS